MTELFLSLWFIYMIVCVICFFVGILNAIFNKKNIKTGAKLLIFSIIGFIIGLGGCALYLNFNPLRI